jgi:hypothetical protein
MGEAAQTDLSHDGKYDIRQCRLRFGILPINKSQNRSSNDFIKY